MAIFTIATTLLLVPKRSGGEAFRSPWKYEGDQRVAVMSVVAAAAYRAGEDLTLTWRRIPSPGISWPSIRRLLSRG